MGVRWYASTDDQQNVYAVFKAVFDRDVLVAQFVWDRSKSEWEKTKAVSQFNFFGDADMDEVAYDDIAHLLPADAAVKSPQVDAKIPPTQGVPGSKEVEQAKSRLDILPNPADPSLNNPEKYVESPWKVAPVQTVDPNLWDNARIKIVALDSLTATDPFLKRKRVIKHIEAMGQALTPFRSYALVLKRDSVATIIDGHHRLMAQWLLGMESAPVWLLED